ncbi:MAG: ComF family protein [Betaproteobacteria bacterium]|nr:ComF family protein [Betaproteobacteria bacterium]
MLSAQCRLCAGLSDAPVCAACVALAFAPRERCPVCAQPAPGARVCGRCLREPPAFERGVALADYDELTRPLIEALKFHDTPGLAPWLAAHLCTAVGALPAPTLILPVPLSAERLRARGYNQAWELARALAQQLQLSARADLLLRVGERAPQAALTFAERRRNVKGAFACPAPLHGEPVWLVDDVMTTGATLDEAARTLRRAGAGAVSAVVVCRTPLSG